MVELKSFINFLIASLPGIAFWGLIISALVHVAFDTCQTHQTERTKH